MKNVIVIPTHRTGIQFLENLLASLHGYSGYPILIVILDCGPADLVLFSSIVHRFAELPLSLETMETNSFELGGLYTAYKKTDYDEFLLLPHSCEIVDPGIFDIVFNKYAGRSVAFGLEDGDWNVALGPGRRNDKFILKYLDRATNDRLAKLGHVKFWQGHIGKFRREILDGMNLLEYLPRNMVEAISKSELLFTSAYHSLDRTTVELFPGWADGNVEEKFGRKRLKIENDYIIKWKTHYSPDMVFEDIQNEKTGYRARRYVRDRARRALASIKRRLPNRVIAVLRQLKRKALLRQFPRHAEFEQSPEDRQASASMSIIVPIHDAPAVTYRCLASLEKYAPESEIILVDDASILLETVEAIRHFSGRHGWKVVRHEKSLGHSEACRAGSNLATRPYLCLLNSDTVVTPWCWRRINEVFDQDQKIGVAGPSTSNTGNPQSLALAEFLSPCWNNNQICAFAKSLLTHVPTVKDLPWISGNAFFIRRSLWDRVGGFDRNLPDYGNEIELCSRVAAQGYRLVWVRNCYIHHFGRQSYKDTLGDKVIGERIRAAEIYTAAKKRSSVP